MSLNLPDNAQAVDNVAGIGYGNIAVLLAQLRLLLGYLGCIFVIFRHNISPKELFYTIMLGNKRKYSLKTFRYVVHIQIYYN